MPSSKAYQAKYDKAADCLTKDRDALLAFYDFPAEHWKHLRTTNPIESTFATVRHRTIRSKGCLSNKTALAMVFKLVEGAQKSWRRIDGHNQLPKLILGVKFADGIEVIGNSAPQLKPPPDPSGRHQNSAIARLEIHDPRQTCSQLREGRKRVAQAGQTKANLSLTVDAPNPSLRDRIQAAALRVGIRVSRALGPATASNLGGHVARTIGPWLPVSRIARANLSRALPELDARARRRVLLGVWENLGRTVAEMPHVGALRRTADGPGWECEDDTVLRALRDRGGPAILFSGHLANWEIGLPVAASLGLTVSWFYRAASNPAADAAIQDMRREATGAEVPMFAKGERRRTRGVRASATGRRAGHARRPEAKRRRCRALFRATGDDHAGSCAVRPSLPLPGHTGLSGAPWARAVPRDLRTADGAARHH